MKKSERRARALWWVAGISRDALDSGAETIGGISIEDEQNFLAVAREIRAVCDELERRSVKIERFLP